MEQAAKSGQRTYNCDVFKHRHLFRISRSK